MILPYWMRTITKGVWPLMAMPSTFSTWSDGSAFPVLLEIEDFGVASVESHAQPTSDPEVVLSASA
jgi:hypothetical protein